jgi:tripartite-type tricarboxylate transporter receptor subunit TctC
MTISARRLAALALLAAASFSAGAAEPGYPTKPIRFIVSSAPGGPNDAVARVLEQPWGESLGRPLVIDNRAGAAGIIATEIAARAPPDGYTVLLGFQGPLAIAPHLGSVPYDSMKDLAPVSLVVTSPFVLLVNPRSPAATVQEWIKLAQSRPGKLNFASGGRGTGSHLSMELLGSVAGARMVHVPYKGAGPAITALLAGEVDVMFAAISAALGHLKADRLRGIAVGGDRRSPLLPALPTLIESGYPVGAASWYAVLVPRATPKPIVTKLNATLTGVLQQGAIRARLVDMAFDVKASTPDELTALLRAELETWRKVVADLGLKGTL